MTTHETDKPINVEGKDIRGNLVTLTRTNPEQLSLFQTFVPDEDKYSNTIELYDAIPKYYPIKHMHVLRINNTFLPHLNAHLSIRGNRINYLSRPLVLSIKTEGCGNSIQVSERSW